MSFRPAPPPPLRSSPSPPPPPMTSPHEGSDTDERHRLYSPASSTLEYSDTDGGERLSPFVVSQGKSRFREDPNSLSTRAVPFLQQESSSSHKDPEQHPLLLKKPPHEEKHHRSPQQLTDRNWVTRLAYSFRSPAPTPKRPPSVHHQHRKSDSRSQVEYPHSVSIREEVVDEESHLLPKSEGTTSSSSTSSATALAAACLQDYQANRPPTLGQLHTISQRQWTLYQWKYDSWTWYILLVLAVLALFVSSGMESFGKTHCYILAGLNFFAIGILSIDLWMRHELHDGQDPMPRRKHQPRNSRAQALVLPMVLFLILLGTETTARLLVTDASTNMVLFSSVFKPLVLFYVSSQARDALEALRRILKIVIRVIIMELLLILMFAAVACRLFGAYDDSFADLSISWLSLFELSTTVVNPSIWMPLYAESKASAVFFVAFIVVAVFYLHSLVLSVVFSTYIQAASEIHERSAMDRQDAVQLAYEALLLQQQKRNNHRKSDVVDMQLVRETLQKVRPHYGPLKIQALVDIIDPSNQHVVDYPTFCTKIRQALNASIRTARTASTLALVTELVAVLVAVLNFVYVILVSSEFNQAWFNAIQVEVGALITLFAATELVIRFNPLRIPDFTPLTRLNATFDGLALVAALISCVGIVGYVAHWPFYALEFILMGRAIDMIRVMRFFQIFRDVVRRSADVFPALTGPIILVVTTMHVFVYIGMALWGGAIDVGEHVGEIEHLYDLNNFNSYSEGVVTMFQVLVVNDWHAIAQVFLFADRCSSPYIVYPFFIMGNLIGVSIMLNVLTAFFVESFVTKLEDSGTDGPAESTTTVQKERDFSIQTAEKSPIKRISSSLNIPHHHDDNGSDRGADADSEASSESELYEFDVFEREGLDKIMQTVAGSHYGGNFAAQSICDYLEIFESLTPGRETVGYLICDQQTLERFGNRRFQTKAIGFIDENQLHLVVSDMHAELLALSSRPSFDGRSLLRTFPHKRDPSKVLEISASLLRRHPALSIFVSRTTTLQQQGGSNTR